MVRLAHPWELLDIVLLAEESFVEQDFAGGVFDMKRLLGCLQEFHDRGILRSLVIEEKGKIVGCLVGVRMQHLMCGTFLLEEIIWFVKPAHRTGTGWARAIDLFEQTAREDCGGVILSRISSGNPKLHGYYERKGLQLLECQHMKLFHAPPCPQ